MAENPSLTPINVGQSQRVHLAVSLDPDELLRALCDIPLRVLDDWEPPATSHMWLDQLAHLFSEQDSEVDPRAWLSQLRDTAVLVWPFLANKPDTDWSPDMLRLLSTVVNRQHDALLVLFRWLSDELGAPDATTY